MKIMVTTLNMQAALMIIGKPTTKQAVKDMLKINEREYFFLREMYNSGKITYYYCGNKIEMQVPDKLAPLPANHRIKPIQFYGLQDELYSLPAYSVQFFSDQTVGNYYE